MSEKRIDIVLVDRIDQNIDKALNKMEQSALKAEKAQDRLVASMERATVANKRAETAAAKYTKAANTKVRTDKEAVKVSAQVSAADTRAAISRERLRKITAQASEAEVKVAIAKKRLEKATVDVTAAEVRLDKARKAQNRTSAVVISKNGELEASHDKVANAATRAGNAAQAGSRKYKAATAASRQQTAQTSNLIFQLQDVVVSLQGGQKPLTVLLQQGAQIQGAFGPGTGVTGILKGLARAAVTMVKPFLPLVAVAAVLAGGFAIFSNEIKGATDEAVSFGDTALASMQVLGSAIYDYVQPAIGLIAPYFKQAYDFIVGNTGNVINFLVGNWMGGIAAMKAAWGLMADNQTAVLKIAANKTVDVLIDLTQKALDIVSAPLTLIEKLAALGGKEIDITFTIPKVKLFELNEEEQAVEDMIRKAFDDARNKDYAGAYFDAVAIKAVENMQKRVEKTLTGLGKNDTSRTEAMNREAASLRANIGVYGDYGKALETAKKRDELLIKAKKEKIKITPGVIAVIDRLASAYGNAAANLEKTKQFKSVVDEIKSPVVEYAQSLDILKQALDEGFISQNQFNNAIANNPLVSSFNDVKRSLQGTNFAYKQIIADIDLDRIAAKTIVEDAFTAGIIKTEKARDEILAALNQKAGIDKAAANDNQTQVVRDFDQGLGGEFGAQAEIDQIIIDDQRKLEQLQLFYGEKYRLNEEYNRREQALYVQQNNRIAAIEAQRKVVILQGFESLGNSMTSAIGDIAGKQSKAYKVMFAASKAFAIAQSIINIQVALSEAAKLPFPLNIAKYAEAAAQGASIISNLKAVTTAGFRTGGVGVGGNKMPHEIAGVVHARETVIDAYTTAQNRPALETLQRTGRLPSETPRTPANSNSQPILNQLKLINETGVPMRMEQLSATEIRLIAEDAAERKVQSEAPKVIEADLANPNSKTSKALSNFTDTQRKYG